MLTHGQPANYVASATTYAYEVRIRTHTHTHTKTHTHTHTQAHTFPFSPVSLSGKSAAAISLLTSLQYQLTGLASHTTYYFLIRTFDDSPNVRV